MATRERVIPVQDTASHTDAAPAFLSLAGNLSREELHRDGVQPRGTCLVQETPSVQLRVGKNKEGWSESIVVRMLALQRGQPGLNP